MDPKATLLEAATCWYSCDDIDRFCDLMAAYYEWRKKGGFEPILECESPAGYKFGMKGDNRYNQLFDKWVEYGGSTNEFYRLKVD